MLSRLRLLALFVFGFALVGCPGQYTRTLQPGEYEKTSGQELTFSGIPSADDRNRGLNDWHLEPTYLYSKIGPEFNGKHLKLQEIVNGSGMMEQYQSALVEDGHIVFFYLLGQEGTKTYPFTYTPEEFEAAKKRVGLTVWINLNEAASILPKINDRYAKHLERVQITDVRPRAADCRDYEAHFECLMKADDGTGWLPYEKTFYFETDPTAGWPSDVQGLVRQSKIRVGMTRDQLLLSWGKPEKINRTVHSNGVNEQWVFRSGEYVYLRDDIIESMQTSGTP